MPYGEVRRIPFWLSGEWSLGGCAGPRPLALWSTKQALRPAYFSGGTEKEECTCPVTWSWSTGQTKA
jgi:hypothetical protein